LPRISVDFANNGAPERPPPSAVVVFVQIIPLARFTQTSQISASMASSMSGAILTKTRSCCTASRIRSRCSGRCSSRREGVLGEETLITIASACGPSFAAQAA